jgi:hypothetical protein
MPFQDRRWYACFTPERHPRKGHLLFDDEASSVKSEESFVFDPKSDGGGIYGPKLWAILSPDGSTYGYVYTVLTELVTKVIDEKTMLVDNVN